MVCCISVGIRNGCVALPPFVQTAEDVRGVN